MPAPWRSSVTRLPTLAVETCWRPYEGDAAGDFTELVDLGDGRFVAVLGDAPGFGEQAAALADTLRMELRRAFRSVDSPAEVLRRLDGVLVEQGEETIATAVCALLDPDARSAEVANAGHLPVLAWAGDEVRFLHDRRDPPLGVVADRRAVLHRLEGDAALFMYTDGLVERRGRRLDDDLMVLAGLVRGMGGGSVWASELARRATDTFGPPTDDATVLSVRLLGDRGAPPTVPPSPAGEPVLLRVHLDRRDLRSVSTERIVRDLARRLAGILQVDVEVVDVATSGHRAEADAVLAAPTVLRVRPLPVVRVIGGLRSPEELAEALQLPIPEEADGD